MVKKAILWTVITVGAVLVITGGVIRYRQIHATDTVPPSVSDAPYRVVGEWEGQVAVFLPDANIPETVYDTPVSALPAKERERLASGVAVTDEAALFRLLEDYLS